MPKGKNQLTVHLTQYHTIYIFTIILFLTGIIFGALIVNSMSFIQKQDLLFYLERFFQSYLVDDLISHKALFKQSITYHIQYLALLFFLGLSVIGLPIIWILVFIKGMVIGFTVGFFVNQLGWQGLLLSFSAIAPQNLIVIPVYILASSFAMIFSLTLIQSMMSKRYKRPILKTFYHYIAIFSILVVGVCLASLFEAIISYESMRVIANRVFN
ncbi:stage II sporulation protein M [Gracilibacillus halophilus YIM-C55.5]|uniref:Stage II sporulation protein M n=1 Tax=Gracilibacillus halophilus YIM-C55.5 TaxID=1308866 RepID=N4WWE1_9BACI|nr:stage II sporulation protein M [Gracilibacillus halophilus]ENH97396.1 stage II sporulation protein M [Gracilibacillus halophilus YIM-C55.5]